MKAKYVSYEELVNTGNFSHRKIAITLELEEGDKADAVFDKARLFVKKAHRDSLSYTIPEITREEKETIVNCMEERALCQKDLAKAVAPTSVEANWQLLVLMGLGGLATGMILSEQLRHR